MITATTLIAAQLKFAGLALTLGDIEIALRIIKLGLAVKTFGDQFAGLGKALFGLQQIRERLASRYGSAARFDLTADSAGGTRACLVLPLKPQP